MYLEFEITAPGDNNTGSFSMLRVAMFRQQWDRWCEANNIDNFQWSHSQGRVRIEFEQESQLSMFALKWQGHSYRIVQ